MSSSKRSNRETVGCVTPATAASRACESPIVTNEEIHKGDRLKLSFYVRSNGADSGKVKVNFQTGGPEYAVLDGTTVVPTSAWTKVERSFTAPIDLAAGGAMFVIQMGYQAQEVEVGGERVSNFGPK